MKRIKSSVRRNIYNQISYSLLFILYFAFTVATNGQVIDYSTTVKIEKGKKITERSFLIQVNSKEHNGLSEVKMHYSANQEFELLEAYIVDPNGKTVRNLKKKEITTKSDVSYGTFYEDDFIKEFALKWNEYPYQIKYKYRVTEDDFVYVAKWYPTVFNDITTRRASLQVELPIDYKVSMDYSRDLQYQTYQQDGKQILQWELEEYKVSKSEIFSPPIIELLPNVSVVPREFDYGIHGNSESWSSYGKWHDLLNDDSDILPTSEKIKVNELIEGVADKKEIVKILYHYLQDNTRYINVAIDVGGLKPYPASYICEKKYGDCKALTIYMKALLKQAGIPSFYTVINAGSNAERINRDLPSQQFNHVILSVPIDNDTLWLENTSSYSPFNYLGTFTQNRYALLVDGENSGLISTPKLSLNDVLEKRTYSFKLNEEGVGSISINKKLKGEAFEYYKFYQNESSKKDQKHRILLDINLKNFELEKWGIMQLNRDKQELNVIFVANCFDQFRKVSNLKVIQPVIFNIPPFEDPDLRKNPVRINFPINKSDSIVYELPFIDKYEVELPNDSFTNSVYGKYEERYVKSGHKIIVLKNFQLYAADYPIESYRDFFLFIESIIKIQSQSVILLTKNKNR